MSKNADGWIRHNSKQQPVDDHVEVEIRTRGGDYEICEASCFAWNATGEDQIMAYRLHKPVEQVEACSKPELRISLPENYGEIIGGSVEGPIQWRDRITEIDVEVQARTVERAELVQKLASEGFALIGRAQDALIGLPRDEWKVGDLVVRVMDGEESGMPLNEPMKITFFDGSDRGQDVEVGGKYFPKVSSLRWHSRPSA